MAIGKTWYIVLPTLDPLIVMYFCYSPISPNLRSTAYCYAVKQGDVAVWDFIFNKFKTENVAGEQVKLLRSLGCTDELWLLQRWVIYYTPCRRYTCPHCLNMCVWTHASLGNGSVFICRETLILSLALRRKNVSKLQRTRCQRSSLHTVLLFTITVSCNFFAWSTPPVIHSYSTRLTLHTISSQLQLSCLWCQRIPV